MSLSETAIAIQNLVRASNSFGFALLQQLAAIHPGNIVVSPFSLSAALTMTANGAGGTTRQSMFKALGLSGAPIPALNAAYSSLIQMYSSTSPSCMFNVANSLWLSLGHPIDPNFSQQIAARYFADVKNIDFTSPQVATALNLWLAQRTNGKITDSVRTIEPNSAAVLVNAAYFKASWQNKFPDQQTVQGTFNQATGPVSVPMMSQSNRFGFCPAEQFDAISLPYQGPVRMSLVVPNTPDLPLDALAAGISMEIWDQIREYLASQLQYGRVTLPKFNIKSYLGLKEGLMRTGLSEAFDPQLADFSGLTPVKPGFISRVEHATCLSIDEHGTDATPSMVPLASQAPIEFDMKVDKPFLLVIEDAQTGAFLFLAIIRNVVDSAPQRTAPDTSQLQQPQFAASAAAAPSNGGAGQQAAPAQPPTPAPSAFDDVPAQQSPDLVEFDHNEATSEFPAFSDDVGSPLQPAYPVAQTTEPHQMPSQLPPPPESKPGDWLDAVDENQMETAASWPSLQHVQALNPSTLEPPQPAEPQSAPLPGPPSHSLPQKHAPAAPPGTPLDSGSFETAASTFSAGQAQPTPEASTFQSAAADAFSAGQPQTPAPRPPSESGDDNDWAPQGGGWGEEQDSDWLQPGEKPKVSSDWAPQPGAEARGALEQPGTDWATTAGGSADWASPSSGSGASALDQLGSDWGTPPAPTSGNWAPQAAKPTADWTSSPASQPDLSDDWAERANSNPQPSSEWATVNQSAAEQSSASGNWKKIAADIPNPPLNDPTPHPNQTQAARPTERSYDLQALNSIGAPGSPKTTGGFNPSDLDAIGNSSASASAAAFASGGGFSAADLDAIGMGSMSKPTGGFNPSDLDAIRSPKAEEQPKPTIADLNAIPTPKPSVQMPKNTASGEWSKVSSSAEGEQLVHGFATKSDPSVTRERRDSLRSLRGGGPGPGGGRGVVEQPSKGFMAAIMNFFSRMFGRKD